ncbi:MAG: hypothetical protein IJB86_08570 [Clostridia bacterium]|nr:hypothetical protein [Clostridia bacterium]
MKRNRTKTISIVTAFSMLFCLASCKGAEVKDPTEHTVHNAEVLSGNTYTKSPTSLTKKEAVFVTLSSDGTVREISVTDRLTSDSSQVRVDDVSSLSDIKNIKGDETPHINGRDVVWHMNTQDLYYSGKTDKSLPVSLKIEYTLNGKKVDAKDIAGKSGKVEINVISENDTMESVELNGKIMNISTPFLIVGGMLLNGTQSGVSVTNGTSVGDGQKELVFAFMLPGLSDSLGLDKEKINIPESFSVSYESSSHEKPQLMFAMIPVSLSGGENILSSVFADTKGIGDSLSRFGEIFSSLSSDTSLKSIISQSDKIALLADAATKTVKSFSQQKALVDVLAKHLTNENAELLTNLMNDLSKVEFSKYAELFADPTFKLLIADLGTVSESLVGLMPSLTAFAQDIGSAEVQKSLESLPQTIEHLSELSRLLQDNNELLSALTSLSEGSNAENFSKIFEAAEEFMKGGTVEALSELSEDSDELMFRFEKLVELGKKYSVFTEAPQDADASVYFVFKTQ